jgi:DNA-binding NtrC family response regulator
MMPEIDGIELLKQALGIDPNLIGVIMTGQGTAQTAVEAMKSGAFDYVQKPFRLPQILPVLYRAMEIRRLRLENMRLKQFVESFTVESPTLAVPAGSFDLETLLRRQVQLALNEMKGNNVHAAKALGVSRRSLYRLIEKYGLEPGKPERGVEPSEPVPSGVRHAARC